ncbi:glycosyltransferase [Streptococcus uberis]|uniref:glycosyltransferase n=1 Tax=Streptococcus uberis TaxID=1349 RepID=UPI001FF49DD8|nr:glycosyltransferase [Streptococcus uberis]MCK1166558.1 glycosyltransferase [Streptococcus uberis]MCK1233071.1 glycosyltransferase [Streptococcus uberis]
MAKKVLHILRTNSFSGAENVAIKIIKISSEEYNSIYVSPPGEIVEILEKNNIRHKPIDALTPFEIFSIIKKEKPDIIHAHDFTAGVMCALVPTKIPIINHLHHNSPWLKTFNIKTIIYSIISFRFKKILTVSASVGDEYIFNKVIQNQIINIGNPIDISFSGMYPSVPKLYDLVFMGRLSQEKNPLLFIELIYKLKKVFPNITGIMIGDGPLMEQVIKKIHDLELIENIFVLGFLPVPFLKLKQGKIMIMPSKWEGFGLAAVEALALGLPVIGSDVGGLKSIIDNSCGKLCRNLSEFYESLVHLLNSPDDLEFLSQGAKLKAEKLNNINEYKNSIIQVYDELIVNETKNL